MLDFTIVASKEAVHELRRIADALERLSPVPAQSATKKPRTVEDLMTTNDETLADIEDEEERKRMVIEED